MTKTVEQAEKALADARSAYLSELERDIHRREGSMAQERRREEHQQALRERVRECERALAVAMKESSNA